MSFVSNLKSYKVVLTIVQKALFAFTSSLTTTINKTQKVHFAKMCLPLPNEKECTKLLELAEQIFAHTASTVKLHN